MRHRAPGTRALGARVRAERQRLGLTQAQAAQRLQVSRTSYAQIEHATTLQYGVLLALVRDVGMDAAALVPELLELSRTTRAGRRRSAPNTGDDS
jgi:transcriptional regulator with XRE-family HTH domain